MEQNKIKIVALFFIGFATLLVSAKMQAQTLAESFSYSEKNQKKVAWRSPTHLIDFAFGRTSIPAKLANDFEKVIDQKAYRLWRVKSSSKIKVDQKFMEELQKSDTEGKYSPILHPTNSPNSQKMALPGGVLVVFDSSKNEQQANEWAAKNGVKVVRKLKVKNNIYLIESKPGLATLQTANTLQEAAEVSWATPDWWRAYSLD